MTKRELKRDLEDFAGGAHFMTVTALARYLGTRREKAVEIVQGLDYLPSGTTARYSTEDIATAIMSQRA